MITIKRDFYKILTMAIMAIFLLPIFSYATSEVIFNEIAWMGNKANSADEWLELYNRTDNDIDLTGWKIYEAGGQTLLVNLTGAIKAKSYYLIERSDDNTIKDITADLAVPWGKSYGFNDSGENLQLVDNNSQIIDELNCATNGWFAGEKTPDRKTMERINFDEPNNNLNNWATNNGQLINSLDFDGNQIFGTPGRQNSVFTTSLAPTPVPEIQPTPTPTPAPEPTLTPTLTPETQPTPIPEVSTVIPEPQPTQSAPIQTTLPTAQPMPITIIPPLSSLTQFIQTPPPVVSTSLAVIPASSSVIPASLTESRRAQAGIQSPNNVINNSSSSAKDNQKIEKQPEIPKTKNQNKLKEIGLITSIIILAFLSGLGLIYLRK